MYECDYSESVLLTKSRSNLQTRQSFCILAKGKRMLDAGKREAYCLVGLWEESMPRSLPAKYQWLGMPENSYPRWGNQNRYDRIFIMQNDFIGANLRSQSKSTVLKNSLKFA